MGILDAILNALNKSNEKTSSSLTSGIIPYGENKIDGSHDHRHNKGDDRTPAQKEGDKKRKKDPDDQ